MAGLRIPWVPWEILEHLVFVSFCSLLLLFSQSVMFCSLATPWTVPGSSVQGVLQASILEWVTISFSRRSFPPRDRTCVSCTGRWVPHHQAT